MLQEMLDLDRDVVADAWMFSRESLDDPPRMRWPVEEIWITERDVLRAGNDLRSNVLEHHVHRNRTKGAAIHRHDRTMPAQVLATARRFGRTHDAPSSHRASAALHNAAAAAASIDPAE